MQDRRDIGWAVNDTRMPDLGWTARTPDVPEATCRWCGEQVVRIAPIYVCPRCDTTRFLPAGELEQPA